ncbi:hypothetical protein LPTSP4_12860 [Leptospira ryugenii]|uniref:Uncharacterized protein n=1 Tax=Leptospira ryugenii TaxID=1917863 RepID=A0A2P2DYR4_9LEPT|nr:hypothetical protein [Leptospira ryugenii]GBF49767.1 hypothetical protein LPTSP4_12860 [Leptospira ryugenii]
MKYYLSSSLLYGLILSKEKPTILSELESLLQNQARFYTSVWTLIEFFQEESIIQKNVSRTILHLITELTEEILPLQKDVLEVLQLQGRDDKTQTIESQIAILYGMDFIINFQNGRSSLRNLSIET